MQILSVNLLLVYNLFVFTIGLASYPKPKVTLSINKTVASLSTDVATLVTVTGCSGKLKVSRQLTGSVEDANDPDFFYLVQQKRNGKYYAIESDAINDGTFWMTITPSKQTATQKAVQLNNLKNP